jgi:hypothetical protein
MRTVYPPLSLRDISPTRGEITLFPRLLISLGEGCDSVADNLPPCGGDVGVADRGGYSSIIYWEAYRSCP